LNRVLFTQDKDLLAIASSWQADGVPFPGLVFAAQRGLSIGRMIDDLELLVCCATESELRSQVFYLPLQ
jgi:hypothetical protein